MRLFITVSFLTLAALAFVAYRYAQRAPGDTPRRIGSDVLAGAIMFALFAPAIGGAAVTITISAIAMAPKNLMMLIFGLPWFYIFGAVPALLCGVVAGALRPARASWWSYAKVALVGGVFGVGFVQGFTSREFEWQELNGALAIGGPAGVLSAFLCSMWLYGKPGSTRPANGDAARATG